MGHAEDREDVMPFYLQERLGNAPLFVRILYYGAGAFLGLLGLGIGIYWCWADVGPYHWLKDLQLAWIGGFYPGSTFILSVRLALLLIALPPVLLLNLLIVSLVPLQPEYRAGPPDSASGGSGGETTPGEQRTAPALTNSPVEAIERRP